MSKDAQKILGWLSVAMFFVASFFLWVTAEQGSHDSPAPTVTEAPNTPTPTPFATITEDGTVVAIPVTPTPTATATVAPTDTPTPTPTIAPTHTQKPTERVSTPKPTNTPTPTKKAQKTQNIVPYPTGKVGTQYTDDKNAHTWKPYARYWKITKKGTPEYKLREMEITADNGLRIVQDPNGVWRYCIALEPRWAGGQGVDIGRCVDIQMTNGAVLHCVLADCKTTEKSYNQEGWYGSRGELIEFIADETKLPSLVHGDISKLSKEFEGGIVSVTVLDLYIKGFGR